MGVQHDVHGGGEGEIFGGTNHGFVEGGVAVGGGEAAGVDVHFAFEAGFFGGEGEVDHLEDIVGGEAVEAGDEDDLGGGIVGRAGVGLDVEGIGEPAGAGIVLVVLDEHQFAVEAGGGFE